MFHSLLGFGGSLLSSSGLLSFGCTARLVGMMDSGFGLRVIIFTVSVSAATILNVLQFFIRPDLGVLLQNGVPFGGLGFLFIGIFA